MFDNKKQRVRKLKREIKSLEKRVAFLNDAYFNYCDEQLRDWVVVARDRVHKEIAQIVSEIEGLGGEV